MTTSTSQENTVATTVTAPAEDRTTEDRTARVTRIRATCLLTIEPRAQPAILGRLKAIPSVERVHSTSGRVDLLLQLACASTVELDEVLDQIGHLTGVRSSESLVHLSTKFDRAV